LRNNAIKCLPSHLNEDVLFTFQVILNTTSCRYIPDVTYYYYNTPTSTTSALAGKKVSVRYAQQYVEIIHFMNEYIEQYKEKEIREIIFRNTIFKIMYFATAISGSTALSKKEKKSYLKDIIVFPVSISEFRKFKNKKNFFFTYLVFHFPFAIYSFNVIDSVKDLLMKIKIKSKSNVTIKQC
jgi:hypothetical protein